MQIFCRAESIIWIHSSCACLNDLILYRLLSVRDTGARRIILYPRHLDSFALASDQYAICALPIRLNYHRRIVYPIWNDCVRRSRMLPIRAGCIRRLHIPGLSASYYHPVRGIIKTRPSRTCIFRNVGGAEAYRVAARQKTIKPGYHPGRRLYHFNFPPRIVPFDPSRRSFGPRTAGIRSPFNLDPTYGSLRPVDEPCRTSYLFYLL